MHFVALYFMQQTVTFDINKYFVTMLKIRCIMYMCRYRTVLLQLKYFTDQLLHPSEALLREGHRPNVHTDLQRIDKLTVIAGD